MNLEIKNFLDYPSQHNAELIITKLQMQKLHNLVIKIGKFLNKLYPDSILIKYSRMISLTAKNKLVKANSLILDILKYPGIKEQNLKEIFAFKKLASKAMENVFVHYNHSVVTKIKNKKPSEFPLITFTITTCKRFELFTMTMNSFLNCCKDLHKIDHWICIDDNSSKIDRIKMKKLYPFFTFIFKTPKQKGHVQSMNMIRSLVKTPYLFHMEDDWKFIEKRNYISECLDVLNTDIRFGQCLINKNYAETLNDYEIVGGKISQTVKGTRFYLHEYCSTQSEIENFAQRYKPSDRHNSYWPHFSFRPSLLKTMIFHELGSFNKVDHFERKYAEKYFQRGYLSVFLEGIYCLHTGRLTSEIFDEEKKNAYKLNNIKQFEHENNPENIEDENNIENKEYNQDRNVKQENIKNKIVKKNLSMSFYVINLERRKDRWEKFTQLPEYKQLRCKKYNAIDGKKLVSTPQLQIIFDNNDYNMKCGMVACAMSHIDLYIKLLNDTTNDFYCIFEDDIKFCNNFIKKFTNCLIQLRKNSDWDLLYLGHHSKNKKPEFDGTENVFLQKKSAEESLKESLGGTFAYCITKKGAEKLLNFINVHGMENCIDTMQQRAANEMNIFYTKPELVYSECFRRDSENKVDTDIQYENKSLTLSLEKRKEFELGLNDYLKIDDLFIAQILVENTKKNFYYENDDKKEIQKLKNLCKFPCFTLEDKILFVCVDYKNPRYFHRFQKDGIWNISEAIQYE